ncbi:MAG: creatininase family protein [Desulfurococcales archaeon]|nr:creatininase family protein [Desulfurococcales archaeon]
MMQDYKLQSYKDIIKHAKEDSLIVIPLGSIEQHCEAPLGTDSIIIEQIAKLVCSHIMNEYSHKCLVAPTIYYGHSPEWINCPGTISLRAETFKMLVEDILYSLVSAGFKKIVLLNGHGGNSGLLDAIAREFSAYLHNITLLVIDYWRPAGLRLGHCDELESFFLREALGKDIDCGCTKRIDLGKGYTRFTAAGTDPCGVKLVVEEESQPVSLEEVARRIASVIIDALKRE